MFSRFLAPALIALGMLACTTELPLEAQRSHATGQKAISGPLAVPVKGYVGPCCQNRFDGTFTITEITRNEAGDSLFAAGTLTGGSIEPTEATLPVQIKFQSQRCVHIFLYFGGSVDVGLSEPISLLQSPEGEGGVLAPSRAWCDAAGSDLAKLDRALATINAGLGG